MQDTGEFEWDSYTQGIILGSFFYGYVITQLPGGRIAEVLGARWMFGLGVFLTAVLTLAIPIASRAHYGALIAIRVIQGLGEVSAFLSLLKAVRSGIGGAIVWQCLGALFFELGAPYRSCAILQMVRLKFAGNRASNSQFQISCAQF